MKKPQRLRNFLMCASTNTIQSNCLDAKFAQGAIEGIINCLMAQGATFDKALAIVKEHMPENISKYALPKYWDKTN